MSTIQATPGQPDRPEAQRDPFFYGWRDLVTTDEHGRRRRVRQPLTRDDVLHPREGDHIVQNTDHNEDCDYLYHVIKRRTRGQQGILVAEDLGIIWDIPGMQGHSPDLTVYQDVQDPERRFDTFNVAQEGTRPVLIIEVTSPSTHDVDLNDKRREYFQAGVPVYVIVEEYFRGGGRHLRILPYRRGPRAYRRQRLDARGRFWLEAVQLWLGQENGRVALYDAEGNLLENTVVTAADRQEAEQRVHQAEQQASEAKRRAAWVLELGRKARRGLASPEEIRELEQLEEEAPPA